MKNCIHLTYVKDRDAAVATFCPLDPDGSVCTAEAQIAPLPPYTLVAGEFWYDETGNIHVENWLALESVSFLNHFMEDYPCILTPNKV